MYESRHGNDYFWDILVVYEKNFYCQINLSLYAEISNEQNNVENI